MTRAAVSPTSIAAPFAMPTAPGLGFILAYGLGTRGVSMDLRVPEVIAPATAARDDMPAAAGDLATVDTEWANGTGETVYGIMTGERKAAVTPAVVAAPAARRPAGLSRFLPRMAAAAALPLTAPMASAGDLFKVTLLVSIAFSC
jgi:hypothetical protein